ncbi:MAG: lactate utilization protein [Alphaproteobacteria bacterium]|nr:lactate utilization protein [Alphaproteobacteria bacterium]
MAIQKNEDARSQILSNIRKAKQAGGVVSDEKAVSERLTNHPAGIIPKRSDLDKPAMLDLFQQMAENVQASVVRISSSEEVPKAVSEYLTSKNLPAQLKIPDDPFLEKLPWKENAANIVLAKGASGGDDLVSLCSAFAGLAETGSLMLHSGPKGPTTLNFLPETHMVVLFAKDVVGAYEDAWARLRQQQLDAGEKTLPRTVNLITGPSRTGDIEQTILLGAHGPHALHILLITDD